MANKITIRELRTMPDIVATVELQKAVWGMQDVEAASPHTLRAIVHAGGAVIAAEADGRLVGFCFGMAAWREGELWLWSHMAGVRPAFQGRGVGLKLKLAQRAWALGKGFRRMAWTFDPLQSGNANFNFNRLGTTARRYSVNHYGDMQDGINAGMASDRLEAQWLLDSPRIEALAAGRHRPQLPEALQMVVLEDCGQLLFRQNRLKSEADSFGIEIPADIAALKRSDLARAQIWQLYVREAMTRLLAAGYIVSGFQRQGDKACYSMSREG